MSAPQRKTSTESGDGIRKRVGKACDRCRLKKSKCDGSHPCTRCKADNAICVFGERKKSHDKVYPKGYVEMLEQQQSQLVAGLQDTYRRLMVAQLWPGAPLAETNGHALTHDILERLDILESKHDGEDESGIFEEDCHKLQQRLISEGATFVPRRNSFGSDSEHSHSHARSSSRSSPNETPSTTHAAPMFDDHFTFQNASPSPINQSPAPKIDQLQSPIKPSPLAISDTDNLLAQSWQEPSMNAMWTDMMRPQLVAQAPSLQDSMQTTLNNWAHAFDTPMDYSDDNMAINPQFPAQLQTSNMYNLQDWTNEPMDVDFSKFVQVST